MSVHLIRHAIVGLTLSVACISPQDDAQSEVASPNGSAPLELDFGGPDTLDILTWNIEAFPKVAEQTPAYLARVLTALKPDVVAIQEVWSPQHLQWVADRLPGVELYIAANDPESGLAFLINTETLEVLAAPNAIYVEQSYDFGYRGPVILPVRYREQSIQLINLHYKCCGDNVMGTDWWDEEYRRLEATKLLKTHLDETFEGQAVIALGDWNDELTDPPEHNVFWPLLEDNTRYIFADQVLAESDHISDWSFPSYPSHIDHILITEPLFDALDAPQSHVETIQVHEGLQDGSWEYYTYLSDHYPVGIRLAIQ